LTVLEYKISFATPAFLGNAEQQAQWRTPPFKALIRQWWRIAKVKDFDYDHKKMLAEEKRLFGTAGEGHQTIGRSKVQLRLSQWELGKQSDVDQGDYVSHNQVPSGRVPANLYLGYGPINNRDSRRAIAPYSQNKEEIVQLKIACPPDFQPEIQDAIRLAALFGTIGSRSRNGWGSVIIEEQGEQQRIEGFNDIVRGTLTSPPPMRRLEDCLTLDWPHALGTDYKGPLVWRLLKPHAGKLTYFESWKDVMHELACIKIAIRISENLKFNNGGKNGHSSPEDLHMLAYPAGKNHNVKGWGNNARLANQLRFKVHPYKDGFAGLIFHFPCGLPQHMATPFKGRMPDQNKVWPKVHQILDCYGNGLARQE
jgi:CRISPR-associated protein Cmr1